MVSARVRHTRDETRAERKPERAREDERLQLRQVVQHLAQCSAGLNTQLVAPAHGADWEGRSGAHARGQKEWGVKAGMEAERRAHRRTGVRTQQGNVGDHERA